MYCKAQSHNWQLQLGLNQTGLAICVQVCDWSTTVRKVVVIAENCLTQQEAQLSLRDPPTLRVIEYFAKSPKVIQGHSK